MVRNSFKVACHTDSVGPGSTFVAIQGFREDGTRYIAQAIERGARTIVVEKSLQLEQFQDLIRVNGVQVEYVDNARMALAQLSAAAYGYPAQKLTFIGVTGTKGKTTTSALLEHMLKSAGYRTALISTARKSIAGKQVEGALTTPQPDFLHAFFDQCVQEGVTHVVLEVAAQALSCARLDGITFEHVVFLNFSLEHLEFYGTLDAYFQAKCAIFDHVPAYGSVHLNGDDARVRSLYQGMQERGLDCFVFHASQAALFDGIHNPRLLGACNKENMCAAASVARAFSIDVATIVQACKTFEGVPGRFERYVLANGATAYIDFAHSPASYEAILTALRGSTDDLIAVFGAGGDRDRSKRPLMGAIAARLCDRIIITNDNPRFEDPRGIIDDICAGIGKDVAAQVYIEPDRQRAIEYAYACSTNRSTIVLLGKGGEEYILSGGQRIPFDERKILASCGVVPSGMLSCSE